MFLTHVKTFRDENSDVCVGGLKELSMDIYSLLHIFHKFLE